MGSVDAVIFCVRLLSVTSLESLEAIDFADFIMLPPFSPFLCLLVVISDHSLDESKDFSTIFVSFYFLF